ncbi:MAG: succinylglutamate desuccinylase/aspartoacylase family protein [Phycisphaerales bacterium]|nr:MAG: succinylglutamate desuccinylase/aspartoacylase family protein [Phycisphaerales bacterium]
MKHPGISISGTTVEAGQRTTVELPAASLYSYTPMAIPVRVICGRHAGPTLSVCAALHGDEINGVEIIRRLLRLPVLKQLRGTLLAVPIVNVYGFVNRSRYLPDRRDLNRSFPGSARGSLTARLADLFLKEILEKSDYGVDIHSGAIHRENLPHVRANLDDPQTAALARAFNVPVILNADVREGSLREQAVERGLPMVLYEAGEALRFDERAVRAGVKGIISVLRELDMLPVGRWQRRATQPVIARSSTWVRAPESGILTAAAPLGTRLHKDDVAGLITDPFGQEESEVRSHVGGVVIGRTNLPLVNEGEALFHVATFESPKTAERVIEAFQTDPLPPEPAIGQEPPLV